ncbi:chromate transporter [candidate division WOR-3 bacterium]|nr:chromate transporter [candidate division WOR-3 bacterium]
MRLLDIARSFAKVGTIGFGGGLGMLALLRNEVVEKRRWLDDQQLGVGVALGQMLPGPFISNYSYYIGYELRGPKGMAVAAAALLFPSFVLMCLLSWLYFAYGSVPFVARLFAGVQPVVVGIMAWATWSIGRSNIKSWQGLVIGTIAAVALFLRFDVLLVVVGCGILGILLSGKRSRDSGIEGAGRTKAKARSDKLEAGGGEQRQEGGKSQEPKAGGQGGKPGSSKLQASSFKPGGRGPGNRRWMMALVPYLSLFVVAAAAGPTAIQRAGELLSVFVKMGTVIFGGGFAAIPFIQHEVVDIRGWLTAKEFIDGVALGQLTPGPVAITATFVGYKVLGLPGALIATLGMFLPSGLLILGLIHVYRRVSSNVFVRGFLSGVMPAVTGMLLASTFFIGRSAITGPAQAVAAPLALVLLLRYRLDPIWLVLGGAVVGLVT